MLLRTEYPIFWFQFLSVAKAARSSKIIWYLVPETFYRISGTGPAYSDNDEYFLL